MFWDLKRYLSAKNKGAREATKTCICLVLEPKWVEMAWFGLRIGQNEAKGNPFRQVPALGDTISDQHLREN